MKLKQLLSGALALALVLTLALPFAPRAKAAAFSDIPDARTAEHAEVLHMLGVVDGTGGGKFNPGGTFSRAQFCKMAVVMLGKKGAVGQYQAYTIFPDVRSGHWAAGYINLAVRGEDKIIAGLPDGRFHPDREITFAETVTILMRMLGYQDSDVGSVWPQGYLNAAASAGLTEGMELSARSRITRAQAAELFCRLLLTEQKEGGAYAAKLGTLEPDMIPVNTDAAAADGTKHAVRFHNGDVRKTALHPMDASMTGRKGTLLLNAAGRILTFLPSESGSRADVTVSAAKADGIVDTSGKKLPMRSDTVVYWRGEATTYGEMFFELRPGTAVTVYYNGAGQVAYLFAGASAAEDAVILTKNGSAAELSRLTDGKTYTLYKNGLSASAADLRQYDAAVYDKASNSIRVSDLRLTGCYADASPNTASPLTVTMMGHTFDVLPGAVSDLARFRLGDQVTLLLTEDFRVAGAAAPEAVKGNAVGIAKNVSSDGATVDLFCGLTLQGNPHMSANAASEYEGQLVEVTSLRSGNELSLRKVSGRAPGGSLNVEKRTLGTAPLADNVRLYDRVGKGPLVRVTLADLPAGTVPASSIAYAQTDYAGRVDVLVLSNVTGDAYTYGRFVFDAAGDGEEGGGMSTLRVEQGKEGEALSALCYGTFRTGDFGGISVYHKYGETYLGSTAELKQLKKVPNAAWRGKEAVSVSGRTYAVSDAVVCWNLTTQKWMTLSEARAFSDTADLYYDAIGGKIRIVTVSQ